MTKTNLKTWNEIKEFLALDERAKYAFEGIALAGVDAYLEADNEQERMAFIDSLKGLTFGPEVQEADFKAYFASQLLEQLVEQPSMNSQEHKTMLTFLTAYHPGAVGLIKLLVERALGRYMISELNVKETYLQPPDSEKVKACLTNVLKLHEVLGWENILPDFDVANDNPGSGPKLFDRNAPFNPNVAALTGFILQTFSVDVTKLNETQAITSLNTV